MPRGKNLTKELMRKGGQVTSKLLTRNRKGQFQRKGNNKPDDTLWDDQNRQLRNEEFKSKNAHSQFRN